MNKYFVQLFQEESTVIIPDLGALTMTNEDSGEIMFLPYLKFDDGKLAGFIAKTEGVDLQEAKNTVAKFVLEIMANLDQGESFVIDEFGSFYKNAQGEIEFKALSMGAHIQETKTEEKESEEKDPVIEEVTEGTAEDLIQLNTDEKIEETYSDDPFDVDEDDIKELIDEAPIDFKPEDIVKEESWEEVDSKSLMQSMLDGEKTEEEPEVKQAIIEEVKAVSEEPKTEKKPLRKKQEKEPKVSKGLKKVVDKTILENELVDKKPEKKKKKRGFSFWMLIGIIAAFLGVGTWAFLNFDEVKKHVPFLAEQKEEVKTEGEEDSEGVEIIEGKMTEAESTPAQSTPTDKVIPSEPIKQAKARVETKPEPVKKVTSTPASGNYHLIIGAYGSIENANKLVAKLVGEGFSASIAGESRGLNLVALGSFNSKDDADAFLQKNVAKYPKAWVMKK
jgi:cell division protein FtsN/nucleoid DNA-binding protein